MNTSQSQEPNEHITLDTWLLTVTDSLGHDSLLEVETLNSIVMLLCVDKYHVTQYRIRAQITIQFPILFPI